MSTDMTIHRNQLSSEAPAVSLTETVKYNLQHRKVDVIKSGLSTLALAGGIVATSVLGGPVGLIIGLAAATLLTLRAFLKLILAQPQNVTKLDPSTAEQPKIELATVSEQIEVPADKQPEAVAQEPVVEQQPIPTEVEVAKEPVQEEKQPEAAATPIETVTPAVKASRSQTVASFVKTHKLALSLGAVALATAGAGLYYYGALTAAASAAPSTCAAEAAKVLSLPAPEGTSSAVVALASRTQTTVGKTFFQLAKERAYSAIAALASQSTTTAPKVYSLPAKEGISSAIAALASQTITTAPKAFFLPPKEGTSSAAATLASYSKATATKAFSLPAKEGTCNAAATLASHSKATAAKAFSLPAKEGTSSAAATLASQSNATAPAAPLTTRNENYTTVLENRKMHQLKFPNRPNTLVKANKVAAGDNFLKNIHKRLNG